MTQIYIYTYIHTYIHTQHIHTHAIIANTLPGDWLWRSEVEVSPGSPIELSLTREPLKKQKSEEPTAVSISLDLDNGDGNHQEEKETIEIIEGRDETQTFPFSSSFFFFIFDCFFFLFMLSDLHPMFICTLLFTTYFREKRWVWRPCVDARTGSGQRRGRRR